MEDVDCDGSETHIALCTHSPRGWGTNDCDHDQDVSISCVDPTTTAPSTTGNSTCTYRVALAFAFGTAAGRVQIQIGGTSQKIPFMSSIKRKWL